jgi:hypothetical protein
MHEGAGFESKLHYGSGSFHMRIKLPDKNSIGVVTAFYVRFYLLFSGFSSLDGN